MRQMARAMVASLHLHPATGGAPMLSVEKMEVVTGKGIVGNTRYFDRVNRFGRPRRRQVSLIAREQIAEHAAVLGLPGIAPGTVRANIEMEGMDLISLLGQDVQIGTAVLRIYEARTPCEKMDRICAGLRELMEDRRQGVLAQVVRDGTIHLGDEIVPLASPKESRAQR